MISLKNELTTGFVVGLIVLTVVTVVGVVLPEVTPNTEPEEDTPPSSSWELLEEESAYRPVDEDIQEGTYEEEGIKSLSINYLDIQNTFELPLSGATGYASVTLELMETTRGEVMQEIPAGKGFVILEEADVWWKINYRGAVGFVYANHCMINLPDVLPSVVYKNTNGSSAIFRSSFIDLPDVTGEKLYDSLFYNERLGKEEYMMPVLYQTAKKIALVQKAALANGETLIIYELFRPAEAQTMVVNSLTALSRVNATVQEGVTKSPFSLTWFINTGVSNHQKGFAIDASLGRVTGTEVKNTGDYAYTDVVYYEEYQMQTPMHELSYHSASMTKEWIYPEGSSSSTLGVQRSPFAVATLSEEVEDPATETAPEPVPDPVPETVPDVVPEPVPDTVPDVETEIVPQTDTPEMSLPETLPPEYDPDFVVAPEEVPEEAIPEEESPDSGESSVEPSDEESWQESWEEEVLESESSPEEEEEEGDEAGTPTTPQPYLSSTWTPAPTMTVEATRLQNYFKEVGMTPIASEWWHFDDFNSGGSEDNKGRYTMDGIFSVEPWVGVR